MKKQNFQYFTGLVVLGGIFYAVGAFSALASFFAENPGSGYTCSGYGYVSGYGYGYSCSALGGGGSSVGSTSTTNENTPTDEETTDENTPSNEETTDDSGTDDSSDESNEEGSSDDTKESMYDGDEEIKDAYNFGFENGLTTLPLEEARLYEGLNRSELAKMMSNFIKNVENQEAVENPVCDITMYTDYATFDDEMKMYIKMACDYGIMGWKNDKSGLIEAFRPLDPVTREEFAAVLSRHLFGSMYDGQDMRAHLEALKNAGIMNQIDNPYVVEVRGYVLVMLQRTIDEEEAMEDDTVEEEMPAEDETTADEMIEDETTTTEEEVTETETGSQA